MVSLSFRRAKIIFLYGDFQWGIWNLGPNFRFPIESHRREKLISLDDFSMKPYTVWVISYLHSKIRLSRGGANDLGQFRIWRGPLNSVIKQIKIKIYIYYYFGIDVVLYRWNTRLKINIFLFRHYEIMFFAFSFGLAGIEVKTVVAAVDLLSLETVFQSRFYVSKSFWNLEMDSNSKIWVKNYVFLIFGVYFKPGGWRSPNEWCYL